MLRIEATYDIQIGAIILAHHFEVGLSIIFILFLFFIQLPLSDDINNFELPLLQDLNSIPILIQFLLDEFTGANEEERQEQAEDDEADDIYDSAGPVDVLLVYSTWLG